MTSKKFAAYKIVKKLWDRPDGKRCFLAVQTALERQVELRLMGSAIKTEAPLAHRFIQEFKLLARLDHPSIAPILDMGCSGGKLYYTTASRNAPYVAEILSRGDRSFTARDVITMGEQVGGALAHMHENSIIHRGLRPSSIRYDADADRYFVAEFEMVRSTDLPSLTTSGVPLPEVSIVAPEMDNTDFAGDTRTDQFLLGCVLLCLAHGKPLTAAGGVKRYASTEGRSAVLNEVRSACFPAGVCKVIEQMIHTNPDERFVSMEAALLALERQKDSLAVQQAVDTAKKEAEAQAAAQRASLVHKTPPGSRSRILTRIPASNPIPPTSLSTSKMAPYAAGALAVVALYLLMSFDLFGMLFSGPDPASLASFKPRERREICDDFVEARQRLTNRGPSEQQMYQDARILIRYLLFNALRTGRPVRVKELTAIMNTAHRDKAGAAKRLREIYLGESIPDPETSGTR